MSPSLNSLATSKECMFDGERGRDIKMSYSKFGKDDLQVDFFVFKTFKFGSEGIKQEVTSYIGQSLVNRRKNCWECK